MFFRVTCPGVADVSVSAVQGFDVQFSNAQKSSCREGVFAIFSNYVRTKKKHIYIYKDTGAFVDWKAKRAVIPLFFALGMKKYGMYSIARLSTFQTHSAQCLLNMHLAKTL